MNTFNLTLDLNKSRASSPVRLRQGDAQGTTITALVLDHGATANLTGMTAQLVMELPDGTQYYRKDASISGNSVSVLVDETQAASVSGRTANAYFQMLQGTTVKASTGSFVVEVLPDALEGHTVPESYDSAIQDAIDALDAAVEQMPDMVEDVLADHPEWTTTVQDGSITQAKLATDLARDRERLLYRLDNLLTAQLPEGETATATDAARTPMAGLALYGRSTQAGTPTPSAPVPIVSVAPDSEGNISLLARVLNQWDEVAEDGYISDTTGENVGSITSYLRSKNYIPCIASTEYYWCGGNAGKVMFYDAGNGYIGYNGVPSGGSTFTTPSDAAYMRFWCNYPGSYNHDICINISDPARNGTYQPYTSTATPIPLDGHELRSLPDGTRDEVTVDERGHAVLVQRVGVAEIGAADWTANSNRYRASITSYGVGTPSGGYDNTRCTAYAPTANTTAQQPADTIRLSADGNYAWLGASSTRVDSTLLYPLATPVTHDLGYVDAVPMCGPDLTAQAVPSAPMQLTYERDLNATLARLESAIAELATN